MPCFRRTALISAVVFAGIATLHSPVTLADKPEDKYLIAAGAAMALPSFVIGTAIHEGTHAIVAKAFGAKIHRIRIFPGRTPRGRFVFGYVTHSRLPRGQRTVVLLAPKFLNLLLLGGYTALVATETLPSNRYGQLALAVTATGQWLDYSKDLAIFWRKHDINVSLNLWGADTFWERLPWRLLHIATSAAAGYVVYKGYKRVFADDARASQARLLPFLATTF